MKTNLSSNWNATVSLILSAACWGFATVMTKRVLQGIPPLTLLVAQLMVSLTFLWLMVAGRRLRVPLQKETLLHSLTGLLNPGLAYTLSLLGLSLTSASMSTLIWAAEPILILGLAWLALRERVTPPLMTCAAVGVLGVMLVAGFNLGPSQANFAVGNLLTVAGVLCCAMYSVLTRRLIGRLHPLVFVALQQTTALILVLILWPIELWHVGLSGLMGIRPSLWTWAAASGIIYYALAYWFYLTALEKVPVSRASLFFNLIPIFGVGAAYVFLGERLDAIQWTGALLILGATVGVMRLQMTKPDPTLEIAQSGEQIQVKHPAA